MVTHPTRITIEKKPPTSKSPRKTQSIAQRKGNFEKNMTSQSLKSFCGVESSPRHRVRNAMHQSLKRKVRKVSASSRIDARMTVEKLFAVTTSVYSSKSPSTTT